MDGASKFVRGDAIAGLLIVFINVIGGMIIGIAQQGMPFAEAARTYTLLTVGDGLVTQIPALIVSTAAGLLVSKAGVAGAADKALMAQLSGYPKALGMSAAVMLVMALLPGIPMLPFLALGGGAGGARLRHRQAPASATARRRLRRTAADARGRAAGRADLQPRSRSTTSRSSSAMRCCRWSTTPDGGDRLTEQIKALRRSLAIELGFVMPAVRILDNVQLEANTYVIKIKEVEAGTGQIWPGQYMVMDPTGAQVNLPGMHTTEPTFGLPATWVDRRAEGRGVAQGLHRRRCRDRALDPSDRAAQGQHGGAAVLRRGAEAAQGAAEGAGRTGQGHRAGPDHRVGHPARAADPAHRAHLDPRSLDHPGRHRRRARRSRATRSRSPSTSARGSPARSARSTPTPGGYLPLIALSANGSRISPSSIVGQGDERSLAMQPSRLPEFITLVRERFEDAAREGEAPVLVTSPGIRPFVRGIVERFRAQTSVLSQSEIHPRVRLKTVGSI